MSPNEIRELIQVITISLAILIPVIGVTVRFSLRPIADATARLRERPGPSETELMLEQRMRHLEAEMDHMMELRASVEQLTEELRFHRDLALPSGEPASARPHV